MKYAALALVGAVSANKRVRQAHDYAMSFSPIPCPFMHEEPKCHFDESENMTTYEFAKKMHYTVINSFARGWYGDSRQNLISDQCFGSWMNNEYDDIHYVINEFKEGNFFLKRDDVLKAGDAVIDHLWKNGHECEFYRMAYDYYDWCYNNMEICYFKKGFMERMQDNTLNIIGTAFEMTNLWMKDDTCYNDTELLGELDKVVETVGKLKRIFHGFEGKWDHEREIPELTIKDMFHNLHNHREEVIPGPHKCPVKAFFEDLLFPKQTTQAPETPYHPLPPFHPAFFDMLPNIPFPFPPAPPKQEHSTFHFPPPPHMSAFHMPEFGFPHPPKMTDFKLF